MDLTYHGGNCIKFSSKTVSIVVDDNLLELGLKSATVDGDSTLQTTDNIKVKPGRISITMPGEYEIGNVSVQGVAARGAMDEEGKTTATIYKITADDLTYVVLGHVYADITDDEIEDLGQVDVLIVPIGGNGYTLDGLGALKIVKKIEPKIVIPTHYADSAIKYEVEQTELNDAIKNLDMEIAEKTSKLRVKPTDLSENVKLYVIERS
jgi:L-ascorbate metabolism protein UlaG (beta-lactamase superfamily)